jgi:hypothetical protein
MNYEWIHLFKQYGILLLIVSKRPLHGFHGVKDVPSPDLNLLLCHSLKK